MKNIILEGNAQFVRKPFDDFIRFMNKTGHKNIELSLMTPHVYIDSEEYIDVCNIKEKLQEFDIKADAVTPAPYRYSITAGEDTEQYRRTLGYYKRCVEYSGYIGADYVIVTGSGSIFDGNHDELISNAAHTLRIICDYADSYGITVLIGAVFGKYSPYNETTPVLVDLEQIKKVKDLCGHRALKVFTDIEVISVEGETLSDWLDAFGRDIKMIRMSDGNYNGYRIWGRGDLPIDRYIQTIDRHNYGGLISLQIPGEKYCENPEEALIDNRKYFYDHMKRLKNGSH